MEQVGLTTRVLEFPVDRFQIGKATIVLDAQCNQPLSTAPVFDGSTNAQSPRRDTYNTPEDLEVAKCQEWIDRVFGINYRG